MKIFLLPLSLLFLFGCGPDSSLGPAESAKSVNSPRILQARKTLLDSAKPENQRHLKTVLRNDGEKGLTSSAQTNGVVVSVNDSYVFNSTGGWEKVSYVFYKFWSDENLSQGSLSANQTSSTTELWRYARGAWCPVLTDLKFNLTRTVLRRSEWVSDRDPSKNYLDFQVYTGSGDGKVGQVSLEDYAPLVSDCKASVIKANMPDSSGQGLTFYSEDASKGFGKAGPIIGMKLVPVHALKDGKTLIPNIANNNQPEKALLAWTGATCRWSRSTASGSGCENDEILPGRALVGDDTGAKNLGIIMMDWTPSTESLKDIYSRLSRRDEKYFGDNLIDMDAQIVKTNLDPKNPYEVRMALSYDNSDRPPLILSLESQNLDLYWVSAPQNLKWTRQVNLAMGRGQDSQIDYLGVINKKTTVFNEKGMAQVYNSNEGLYRDLWERLGPRASYCSDYTTCYFANQPNALPPDKFSAGYKIVGIDGGDRFVVNDYFAYTGDLDFAVIEPLHLFADYKNESSALISMSSFVSMNADNPWDAGGDVKFKLYSTFPYGVEDPLPSPVVINPNYISVSSVIPENMVPNNYFIAQHCSDYYKPPANCKRNFPYGVPLSSLRAFYTQSQGSNLIVVMAKITDSSTMINGDHSRTRGGIYMCVMDMRSHAPPYRPLDLPWYQCNTPRWSTSYGITKSAGFLMASTEDIFPDRNFMTTPKSFTHSISPDGNVSFTLVTQGDQIMTWDLASTGDDNLKKNGKLISKGRTAECTQSMQKVSKKVSENRGYFFVDEMMSVMTSKMVELFTLSMGIAGYEIEADFIDVVWHTFEAFSGMDGATFTFSQVVVDDENIITKTCQVK